MTETECKEMLLDIISNDALYDVKKCNRECNVADDGLYCDCVHKKWVPYKLGDEIRLDWEYRKVEKWCITTQLDCFEFDYLKSTEKAIFTGRKEDCEKYVEDLKKQLPNDVRR